jgi:hypothetical protein
VLSEVRLGSLAITRTGIRLKPLPRPPSPCIPVGRGVAIAVQEQVRLVAEAFEMRRSRRA